jgi:hypothetical protein
MKGVGSLHSSTTNQPLLRYLQLQCYKTHASVELQPGLAVVRNVHCLRAIATQAHCCQNHCGSKVLHNTCCLIVSNKRLQRPHANLHPTLHTTTFQYPHHFIGTIYLPYPALASNPIPPMLHNCSQHVWNPHKCTPRAYTRVLLHFHSQT